MREYLIGFWKDFEYTCEDAAYLLEVYDRITANRETARAWETILERYEADIKSPWKELIEATDPIADALAVYRYTIHLLLVQCLSRRLHAEYTTQGLGEELYHNAMLDLRYKLEECKLVRGIIGTFVAGWFDRFFNVTRFAFGRLQFELIAFGRNYEKNGCILTPESTVINVHIPRTGTPMDEASCNEAFQRACQFYRSRGEIGEPCVFYCSSWLLYPEQKHFLSQKSNVYKFMNRFDVIESRITPDNNNLWRLFDTDEKNPDRLPGDSFLRRAYIEHLKKGGRTGSGRGLFIWKDGQ